MKELRLSKFTWESIKQPIPETILFRVISSDEFATEIEIDAENFELLMGHLKVTGINKITKEECDQISALYYKIHNPENDNQTNS